MKKECGEKKERERRLGQGKWGGGRLGRSSQIKSSQIKSSHIKSNQVKTFRGQARAYLGGVAGKERRKRKRSMIRKAGGNFLALARGSCRIRPRPQTGRRWIESDATGGGASSNAEAASGKDLARFARRLQSALESPERDSIEISASLLEKMERSLPAAAAGAAVTAPDWVTLRSVCITAAVPFVGFGFVDNFVMILAGDYIDLTLGVTLGISTLAAAALGNLVSDLGGVYAGGLIERGSMRLGFAPPRLSYEIMNHPATKRAEYFGNAIGVAIGCLLGMLPLWFIDANQASKLKRQEELSVLFQAVFDEVHELLDAERGTLFLIDEESNGGEGELWSTHGAEGEIIRVPLGEGIAGKVAKTGVMMNIKNAQSSPFFYRSIDEMTGYKTRSVLCMPIFGQNGTISGVVEIVNKRDGGSFDEHDEQLLEAFCSHIGIAVQNVGRDDRADLLEALRLCKAQKKYLEEIDKML